MGASNIQSNLNQQSQSLIILASGQVNGQNVNLNGIKVSLTITNYDQRLQSEIGTLEITSGRDFLQKFVIVEKKN